jgi:hypothetical protein
LSVEGAASQVLDTETRELTVPDLTAARAVVGTPQLFRTRTARDRQLLLADADAVPSPVREFGRAERLLVRVPTYGPGNTTPSLNARLLNRTGQAIGSPLLVTPSSRPGVHEIDVPLAGLVPGEYILEITAPGEGGGTSGVQELVAFRVTS